MNDDSFVHVVLSAADYYELLDLLRLCADVMSYYSELNDLCGDFNYFCECLESNRR